MSQVVNEMSVKVITSGTPVSPDQVQELKNYTIPREVIDIFNELIIKNWDGSASRIYQNDIVSAIICSTKTNITEERIFAEHFLDIESLFIEAGWKVTYNKPAYNETYPAYFIFSCK